MSLPPLYALTDELVAVMDALLDVGGELTPELEEALAKAEGSFTQKAERIALAVRHLTATAAAAREERERLDHLYKVRANAADRLKNYLLREMVRGGREKIETNIVRVGVYTNPRPAIHWLDVPETIPEAFRRVEVSLDGDAAYRAWKDRGVLPEGFAVEQGQHLRIK